MKTLVILSDGHSGSVFGLTPPHMFSPQQSPYYKLQYESWGAFIRMAEEWQSPDILLYNGDAIEGRQEKQGGAELITNDRNIQTEMAIRAIEQFKAKNILMVYGTKYHVGEQAEDFEYNIARRLNAKIAGKMYFETEGLTIEARHKVGRSGVPHGRATPLLRTAVWNNLKAASDKEPRADIIVRSHVHYFLWAEFAKKVMFTTPALQLARGRYGSREVEGEVHWGAIRLTLDKGQIVRRDVKIWNLLANKPKVFKIE